MDSIHKKITLSHPEAAKELFEFHSIFKILVPTENKFVNILIPMQYGWSGGIKSYLLTFLPPIISITAELNIPGVHSQVMLTKIGK